MHKGISLNYLNFIRFFFLGISQTFQNNQMIHDHYKDSLLNQNDNVKIASTIHFQVKHHNIYTVEKNKRYLVPFNDKKYFFDSFKSLSFGHKDIPT